MTKITVLDYGLGNLLSVKRAIQYNNFDCLVSNSEKDIEESSHLIIPGVGSFSDGMKNLKKSYLSDCIFEHAKKGLPILGICLGMQLLADFGYEGGGENGLGLISGKVEMLPTFDPVTNNQLKVPNIGWRKVSASQENSKVLFDQETNHREFYHVHSYQFLPSREEDIIGISKFGSIDIAVAIRKDNIFGTQFHPEKSGESGLHLLKNFLCL